jgi:hypothetical protein
VALGGHSSQMRLNHGSVPDETEIVPRHANENNNLAHSPCILDKIKRALCGRSQVL